MKKYRTPNGQVVDESVLRQKYGDRFDSLVSDGTFSEHNESNVAVADNNSNQYVTPNGQIVTGDVLSQKYGDRFNTLVNDGTFKKKVTSNGTSTPADVNTGQQNTPSNSTSQLPLQNDNAASKVGADIVNATPQKNVVPDFSSKAILPTTNNPFEIPSAQIFTNDGVIFNIPNAGSLGLTNDVIKGIQNRVATKTATPEDINILSRGTGKPESAITAYINNNKNAGSAVEANDQIQKNNQALLAGINNVNKMFGLNINPNDILGSADKTATFLNGVKNIVQTDIQRRKEAQSQKYAEQSQSFNEDFAPPRIELTDSEKDLSSEFLKQVNDYTQQLQAHVVNKTVEEDLQNGVPRETTITKIFKRTDPQGYNQNIKASIPNLPSTTTNPIQDASYLVDYLKGDTQEKDDLLNSQRGIAEQQYNNSLQNLGIEKKSQGVINNNPDLIKQGDDILAKVDYNVTDKYPQLVKQEMVRRVNESIARESGVVQGSAGQEGHTGEKIFGADVFDYARHLKEMGYFDNPKTKDLAIDLLQHPSVFADNSIMGSMGNSFLQPFKDLGMSVGDITGFRTTKDIATDKIKDNLFPKDFSANEEGNLQLKGYVKGLRTILNTTANLAGMVTIAAATEGLGTGAGLSTSAAKSLGAYTSFGLPSFDAALKDAPNIGLENTAAQYLYATINSIANAEGGRLLDLGKITRIPNVSEDFAKIANNITDESVVKQSLESAKNKYIDFAVKYGKNVTKGAATMAYFNIANNITKLAFGDPNTNEEDILPRAGNAFMGGVLGMSIMGGFGAAADMRNEKNTSFKGTIYNLALNHDAGKDVLDIGLKNGTYTKPEYESKVQILNTARVAKNTIDAHEQDTGIPLTQEQKAVYVANKTSQAVLIKKSEEPGIPEETKNKYVAQANRLAEQSTQVLGGLKFTPTLEPLYNLFDAEKKLNEAQEKFNPADKKNEDEFLKAKDDYEKLYTEYLKGNSESQNKPAGAAVDAAPILEVKDTEIIPNFEKVKSFIPEENLDETQNVITKVNNADNINIEELNKAEDNLYTALDKAPEAAHLIEPLILKLQNYPDEFKTKTEVSTVTEKVPVEGSFAAKSKQEIKPALERSTGSDVTITNPDGGTVKGKLDIKSGQYVVDVPQGTQRIIGEKAITDNSLSLPTVEEMENPIEFDKDGNVSAVTVKTKNGNLITIHNPETALDIAIQLHSDMVGEIPDAAFEKAYQEVQKEIKTEVPLTENISSSKTNTNEKSNDQKDNSKSNSEANGQSSKEDNKKDVLKNQGADKNAPLIEKAIALLPEKNNALHGTPEQKIKFIAEQAQNVQGDGTLSSLSTPEKSYEAAVRAFGKDLVDAAIAVHPLEKLIKKPEPPTGDNKSTANDNEDNGVTHINKKDITQAEDLAKSNPLQGGSVSWDNSVKAAISTLAKEAKEGETLSQVANRKIAEWGIKIDKELQERGKSTFNPSDEDLATMSYYRTHLNEQLKGLSDRLNSDNDAERLTALTEAKDIQDKILAVDHVLSESGKVAGRSFYIRQMTAKMDAENNLTVRRMDIMRAQNGESLTPEQEEAVVKIVAEENKINKERENNFSKFSQEDFDAKVKQEVDRILKEKKNKGTQSKSEKTLSQSGKEWADKIRKLKSDKGTLQTDITFGLRNAAVELVAQLVEKGAKIGDAIKQVLQDIKFKDLTEDDLTKHIVNGIGKSDTLDKIKELATEEKSSNLTKSAVGKGLINDLVNHHIENGLRGKEVFDEVNKDLKEIFPNISEQQVRDAYLKQGEFKLDKEANINKEKIEAQNQLKNIANLETKLHQARENKVGAKTESQKRKWSDEENRLSKELSSELNKRNIKLERSPKEEVEIKKKVAASHNERMDNLIKGVDEKLKDENISNEEKTALNNLKNAAELSKINLDTAQRIDEALKKSATTLRNSAVDIAGDENIFKEVSKSVADLNSDLRNATQDILLQRYKKTQENKIKESERKIEAQEFDNSPKTIRTKSDAESVRLEIEARKIEAKYRRLQTLAEQRSRTWWEKGLSLGQTFLVNELIGGLKTAFVVGTSGIVKQPLNTISNFTFGSLAHAINPKLSMAAGAEAPFSLRQEANRYTAHYAGIGEQGMRKIFDKSENKLNEANKNYETIKSQLDKATKGTPEYKKLEDQLTDAKNKQLQALISHQSNFLFKWIGSNAWKDAGNVFLKGASQLDNLLGRAEGIGWKDMTNFEKTEFVMSAMGALHGTFKNFSARAEFAGAFTARLENKARRGDDISQPDVILRTANESYVNFLMGKYQEDNLLTTAMNRVGKLLEDIGSEPSRYGADLRPKNEAVGKAAAALYRGRYPIIRTGLNIGKEAITEYLLGSVYGGAIHGIEMAKAIAKAGRDGIPISEAISDHIKELSPDKIDLIFRCYRKGGIGLVGMALAAYGFVKFGGFYNQDDWQRRKGELHQGDVEIFGHVFDHKSLVAKAFTHNAGTMGALMVANTKQVMERKYARGKDKGNKLAAIEDALISDLEGAANIIPVMNTGLGNPLTNPSVPYGRAAAEITEMFDTNNKGVLIARDKSTTWHRFLQNTGFRKFVPVDTNPKHQNH